MGLSTVGAEQLIEQVAEPSLEHLDLGFCDRNGSGSAFVSNPHQPPPVLAIQAGWKLYGTYG